MNTSVVRLVKYYSNHFNRNRMKKSLLLMLALYSTILYGQDKAVESPSALFKVTPQNFIVSTLKIGTEVFNKSRSKSLQLLLYGRFNTYSRAFCCDYDHYKGVGGELMYRKYISPLKSITTKRNRSYLQGIYVGGYVQGAAYSNKGDYSVTRRDPNTNIYTTTIVNVNESTSNWGTGFTIGVHRAIWSVLFIDAYIGGGIQWSDINRVTTPNDVPLNSYYGTILSPGYQGVMPKFGIQIGVPF